MTHFPLYIHQQASWTDWQYDSHALLPLVSEIRLKQGQLMGRLQSIGFELNLEAQLNAVTLEVIKTSEIEGELLNQQQVRSSVARFLGVATVGLPTPSREVEAVVEMLLKATFDFAKPLTLDELLPWHRALFPTGFSGLYAVKTGQLRDDSEGAMQVVSGGYGRTKVHFEAPSAERLMDELSQFLAWFNTPISEQPNMDWLIKAGIAHLWFITIHPFDDGNGRLTRAITERALANSDGSPQRFYSLSAQILLDRKSYYEILEKTQKGDNHITDWLVWFLTTLNHALIHALVATDKIMFKAKFWQVHSKVSFNDRQTLMLNKLLTDFYGSLTTKKWAIITKVSADTALRDINDLIDKGVLQKNLGKGKNITYQLNPKPCQA
ncbi:MULTISPECIES: Fic family protein [unclassified Moraxella]|uniref:Fic family protein n=1 Tax=unclassified Moraxella TaxID=2685852 RepID=UPI003AF5D918